MELKLFGGLRLETPGGAPPGRAGQPRRLALLAILALSRGRTLRREQIIELLWPDRTPEAARHQLSSAVHDLRNLLGEDALEASRDSLTLRLGALEVDTLRFEAAVRERRWADASSLYTGDLLEGVNFEGSVELEQFLDERRQRFAGEHAVALEREGDRLTALGMSEQAVGCWVRLAEVRPYDTSAALRLMRAMQGQGDRPGALEWARHYTDRLRRDLDAGADPEIQRFVAELRSIPAGASVRVVEEGMPSGPAPAASSQERRAQPLRWFGLAALAGIVTLVLGGAFIRGGPHPTAAQGLSRLVVFPFVTVGDSQYRYLGEGMARLLSTDLDGGGRLITVSPAAVTAALGGAAAALDNAHLRAVAEQLKTDQYVTGTAVGTADWLRLTAVMHTTGHETAPPKEVTVEGPAAGLVGLVDSLTSQLLVAQQRPSDRLVRIAAATTHSIPALKEYLRGDRLFRDGAYAEAAAAFERATEQDPTFALAHYRCSLGTLWADAPATSTSEHDAQALRYADRLAPRDRELVLAYLAWRRGDAAEADRRYRTLWVRYPDDAEAGFQLAETAFHYGPLMGRPVEESRGLFREVLRIDSTHRGARWHLALLDGLAGRNADLSAGLDWMARSPTPDPVVRGLARRLRGKSLASDSTLRTADPEQLWSLGWRLAVNLRDYEGAEEAFDLVPHVESSVRWQSIRSQGLLRLARGQWRRGVETLRGAERGGLSPSVETLDGLLINGIFSPPRPEIVAMASGARGALEAGSLPPNFGAGVPRAKLLLALGRLSVVMDDSSGVRIAREGFLLLNDSASAHSLNAFVLAKAGHTEEALRELDQARRPAWFGVAVGDPFYGQPAERFLRAELLLGVGRLDEALRVYGTFGEFALDDLPYLARAEQRRAEIFERLGRRAEAVQSLEHAAALLADADPGQMPFAALTRPALTRLKGTP